MNTIHASLLERKSVRAFLDRAVEAEVKSAVLDAAFQAPTAGNQMLYSIIDVTDPALKERLAVTCDNQPFIAKAPLVLVFLADCRRWLDAYREAGLAPRSPGVGDLLLAIQDAVIAAQNAVVAAESFGLGSCYIGDILEQAEEHRTLFHLEEFVLPITMVVMGYPTPQQKARQKPRRFERRYIVHENRYRRLAPAEHRAMFEGQVGGRDYDFDTYLEKFFHRKYMSDFALEMNRSSGVHLESFLAPEKAAPKDP